MLDKILRRFGLCRTSNVIEALVYLRQISPGPVGDMQYVRAVHTAQGRK